MRRFLILFILCAPSPVRAGVIDKLKPGPVVRIAEVVDGDTVVLEPPVLGASQIRLVGIQAPKLPLGRKGFSQWPLAPRAKSALETLALGKTARTAFGGARKDRHGRLLAHLFLDNGAWVQGRMLTAGMARVYSFPDNRAVVTEMLGREREARSAARGIWSHSFYDIRNADPDTLHRFIGTFQLIEGRVLDAARVKSRVFLNFGSDWRSDFTVSLDGKARRVFSSSGIDPLSLESKRVRVRGWLSKRNGPAIRVSHPEQIEILPE